MNDWLLILFGLVTLLAAADGLVRGSVWCALVLGITPMMVGLTLVAFGTSAPELFVSLTAVSQGSAALATGNILGSNIANIGLIVGLAALVKPITHSPGSARFETRFLVLTSAVLFVPLIAGTPLDLPHGITLLLMLAVFNFSLISRERRRRRNLPATAAGDAEVAKNLPQAIIHIGMVAVGFLGLSYGSDWLVEGSCNVASQLGMSEALIGVTIVAIGTSLPELATSVVAAAKGHPEIALGNVLGSNVFNVCMVLGATSTIAPLSMGWRHEGTAAGLGLLLAVTLAGLLRRGRIGRAAGGTLLAVYLAYLTAAILTD